MCTTSLRAGQVRGLGRRPSAGCSSPIRRCAGGHPLKFNSVLTNAIILHNTLDIADVVRQLKADGEAVAPEDLARISPLLHRAQHALRRVLNP